MRKPFLFYCSIFNTDFCISLFSWHDERNSKKWAWEAKVCSERNYSELHEFKLDCTAYISEEIHKMRRNYDFRVLFPNSHWVILMEREPPYSSGGPDREGKRDGEVKLRTSYFGDSDCRNKNNFLKHIMLIWWIKDICKIIILRNQKSANRITFIYFIDQFQNSLAFPLGLPMPP